MRYSPSLPKVQLIFAVWQMMLVTLLVVIGYLVTPILFALLTSKIAGGIAGVLFAWSAAIVMVSLAIMMAVFIWLQRSFASINSILLSELIMIVLTVYIAPQMQALKAKNPLGVAHESVDWPLFAVLHGVYQVSYLAIILLMLYWALKTLNKISLRG